MFNNNDKRTHINKTLTVKKPFGKAEEQDRVRPDPGIFTEPSRIRTET